MTPNEELRALVQELRVEVSVLKTQLESRKLARELAAKEYDRRIFQVESQPRQLGDKGGSPWE
jgi:hypothetical protein